MKKLPLCLLLCLGGEWLAGLLNQNGIKEWYPHLTKPFGTPANIVFPIVWTVLYIFMAIALALLWESKTAQKGRAFLFFAIQLFLNFSWSVIFFYFQNPLLALVDLVLLWIFIFLTIRNFWRHTPLGASLLLPYLAWVTYAFYLNLFIWIYNFL